MPRFLEIIRGLKKWLFVPLLCIMAWQQWSTFLRYQEKFLNPIHFIKENYGNDNITQYGKRFVEVKKMFSTPTRLNYVSEANESYGFSEGGFALAQYYLAPNLLFRNNTAYDTILYNLYNTIHIDPTTNFHLNNGWHVVKDFNNGLIILAK